MDVVDLKEFYASRLGQATRRIIVHRLRGRLHGLRGSQILGLGYATPYLDMLKQMMLAHSDIGGHH